MNADDIRARHQENSDEPTRDETTRETKAIGTQIPKEAKHRIRIEAVERSTPDDEVTQSDLVRHALSEYLDIPLEDLEP